MTPKKRTTDLALAIVKKDTLLNVSVDAPTIPKFEALNEKAVAAVIHIAGPEGQMTTYMVGEADTLREMAMYLLNDSADDIFYNFLLKAQGITVEGLRALFRKGN